jgi:hypothetical protein
MHRPFPALLLCVALGACRHASAIEAPAPAPEPVAESGPSSSSAPADTSTNALVREFRGSYTRGFEASWFAPCDTPRDDALWWVTLTEEARLQRDSLLKALSVPATGALAVRWRGTTSPRMQAGHMGQGTRYLLVTQVLEVRPLLSKEGCPFRSASVLAPSVSHSAPIIVASWRQHIGMQSNDGVRTE